MKPTACSCGRKYRIPTNLEVCELDHASRRAAALMRDEPVRDKPLCEGFAWLGQPFYCCEMCGEPAWEHDKMQSPPDPKSGPFSKTLFQFDPLSDEMKQTIRRRWEPEMLRVGYVPPSRRPRA